MNEKFIRKGKNLLKNKKLIQQEIQKEKLVGITIEQYTEYLKLKKENEELKKENAILKRANNISEDVKIEDITKFINKSIEDFNKEYIPVAKIKENIEELETMIEKINRGELQKYTVSEIFTFKAIYEKLLEGK